MYDVKSAYNQAKAMVMNYSEMEQKVREMIGAALPIWTPLKRFRWI